MSTAVVVGGGAIGSALFRELSVRGVRTTLVDDAAGASWHSFAWINAAAPTPRPYHELRIQGVIRHLLYSAPRGIARFDGALAWDGEEGAQPVQGSNLHERVPEAAARLTDWGHQAELVDATAVGVIEPALETDPIVGQPFLWSPDEGWVDLPRLVAELRTDAMRSGGRVMHGRVDDVVIDGCGHVAGVSLANGDLLTADHVAVAAGAGTSPLLARVDCLMPVDPSHGLIVRTAPLAIAAPRRVLRGPEVSIRPEPGNRVVLHSGETDPVHAEFDAGQAREAGEELLARARPLLSSKARLHVQSIDFGIRPLSSDHLPVVGYVPGVAGLYSCQAHSGATVCLVIAELAARELVDGCRSEMLAGYGPDRFGSPTIG
ncbi:MAG: FAD-binding oxidoreductase [Microbacterium sp.]